MKLDVNNFSGKFRGFVLNPSVLQAFTVVSEQGILSFTTFVTGILVARAYGEDNEGFGLYVLGMTIMMTLLGFQRSLISVPFTVINPKRKGRDKNTHLGNTLLFELGAISLLVGVGIVGGLITKALGYESTAYFCLSLLVASAMLMIQDFLRSVLLTDLRVWMSFGLSLASRILILVFLSWMYVTKNLNVYFAFAILAAGSVFFAVMVLVTIRRRLVISTLHLMRTFRENFAVGKWTVSCHIVYTFAGPTLPWLLAATWGNRHMAILGACNGATSLLGYLGRGLGSFFLPKMSQIAHEPQRLAKALRKSVVLLSGLALAGMFVFLFFGEKIVAVLYSSSYDGLGLLPALCFASIGLSLVGVPITMAIHAMQRSDVALKGLLLSLPVTFCAGGFLTWKYGVWGMCLASFLSTFASLTYWSYFLARTLHSTTCVRKGVTSAELIE